MSQHVKAAMDQVNKPSSSSILDTKDMGGSPSSSPSIPPFVGCRGSLVTVTSRLATSPAGVASAASGAALFPSTPSKLPPSLAMVTPGTSYSSSTNQLTDNLSACSLSGSKTTGARFEFKKKLSFSNNDSEDKYFKEEYKDTPDHIEIIKNLPRREEEVFKDVKGRLSGPTNYKFLALLYSGEETVEVFQLTRETFREKYGEEFEEAEVVQAAGPTGGKGKDKVRDAVLKVRSATWIRGITWIFNSLTQFVKAKSEFR